MPRAGARYSGHDVLVDLGRTDDNEAHHHPMAGQQLRVLRGREAPVEVGVRVVGCEAALRGVGCRCGCGGVRAGRRCTQGNEGCTGCVSVAESGWDVAWYFCRLQTTWHLALAVMWAAIVTRSEH